MQTQANRQTANNVSDVSSRAEQAEAEMKPQFAVGDSLFALTNATQLHSILWSTKCTNEHKNWEAAFEHPLDLPLCVGIVVLCSTKIAISDQSASQFLLSFTLTHIHNQSHSRIVWFRLVQMHADTAATQEWTYLESQQPATIYSFILSSRIREIFCPFFILHFLCDKWSTKD